MQFDRPTHIVAGDLNRRITIKKQSGMPAMGAAITQNYTLVKPLWAKIQPVGAAIYFNGRQVGEGVTHRVFVRRCKGVVTEQLIDDTHVIDQVIESVTYRYRVRRASDLADNREFIMFECESLGAV